MTQNKPSRLPRGAGMYGATMIWGTWVLVLNATQLHGIYTLFSVGLPTFTGCFALILWLYFTGQITEFTSLFRQWKLARWVVLVGLIEVVQGTLHLSAMQMAIRDGGSMLIPVVRSFMGVGTPLLALVLNREERFSPWYLAVGALATAGAVCIGVWGKFTLGDQISVLALVLVFLSMLMASAITLLMRIIAVESSQAQRSPIAMMAFQMMISAGAILVPMLVLAAQPGAPDYLGRSLTILAIIGISHMALALVLRQLALRSISGQHAAIIGYTESIVSVTMSVVFLGEQLTLGFVVGASMILCAAAGAQYVALRHSALKHRIPA